MEITDLISEILIQPTEELDEAYNRVLSIFEENNFQIYKPDYLNSLINAKEFTRILNIYQGKIKYTIFVIIEPWNEQKINGILNSFSQPDENSRVHFISAYPLPDIISFINKNTKASFFELDAIRNLKNIINIADDPDLIKNYSAVLNSLSQKYFTTEIDFNVPQNLKNLEKVIIEHFRNGEPYDHLEEVFIDYFPYYSMLLFGLFLSDLISQNFNGELFFKKEMDIKELGIGFSKNNDETIDVMAHPVKKVINFFFYGKDSSIINWYYELKYFFQTK